MIPTRRFRRWLMSTTALLAVGCATSPPLRVPVAVMAPSEAAKRTPLVQVRSARSDELADLLDFPGRKKSETTAHLDSAGTLVLAPVLFVCFAPEFFNPDNWHTQPAEVKEALAAFPDHMKQGVVQQFRVPPAKNAGTTLEIVYYADIRMIGPGADMDSFVVHAWIILSQGSKELFRDTIRIDPRAYSVDIPQPDRTESADQINAYAQKVIPAMIRKRLPSLPWRQE